eukprot:CAMPEP_0194747924 /NCGR_PEP_ID=MMETSP0323_2-20130528/2124_1 /TAXON_ID=2866 ORGANISM="Crypthecodinium cohnii, Strain Seligo" /NCGR_SAMPLE_ID=MMETSP0323_2 /ASSEMBLY_ACC=CAM_ASM_000346 /LENGTH=188 /DNA_ID=CAMNT_0039661809 /DNA_START=126 /DNA_END=693 /DNA_ORIENTATION=+
MRQATSSRDNSSDCERHEFSVVSRVSGVELRSDIGNSKLVDTVTSLEDGVQASSQIAWRKKIAGGSLDGGLALLDILREEGSESLISFRADFDAAVLDDPELITECLEEAPIVGDDHDWPLKGLQAQRERVQAVDIQMVRRLIQQEAAGQPPSRGREREAHLLAAGEVADLLESIPPEAKVTKNCSKH